MSGVLCVDCNDFNNLPTGPDTINLPCCCQCNPNDPPEVREFQCVPGESCVAFNAISFVCLFAMAATASFVLRRLIKSKNAGIPQKVMFLSLVAGGAVGALRQLFYVTGVTPGTIGIVAALALYDQDFIFMAFLTVVCVWINSYHGAGRNRRGANPLSFGKYTGPYIIVLIIQFMFSFVSNMIIITPGTGDNTDEWRAIFLFFNNVYSLILYITIVVAFNVYRKRLVAELEKFNTTAKKRTQITKMTRIVQYATFTFISQVVIQLGSLVVLIIQRRVTIENTETQKYVTLFVSLALAGQLMYVLGRAPPKLDRTGASGTSATASGAASRSASAEVSQSV